MNRTTGAMRLLGAFAVCLLLISLPACKNNTAENNVSESSEENEKYDGPEMIARMEYERTIDPALGRVPRERLMAALDYTRQSKINAPLAISGYGNWTERGPNSDVVGPSNGNTRANSGVTAGRVRAVLVDLADATGNTVWVGGVNGGIWKTTDISTAPANWTLVNDFFGNMAVTSICQNPANTNIMYFATGEWCFNADAVAGDGVWKSTDHGVTWTQLASTTSSTYDYCSKILCDNAGNVYLSTRSGVFRSTDGGTSWTTITPSGLATSRFSDMELSNTGRLHVSAGQFSTCAYRYTDNPSTVTTGTWTAPTSGYPSSSVRIELGCLGNTLYALPSDASYEIPTIYKSTDGGANWASTTGQPTVGWGAGQAWYNMAVDIDPNNVNNVVVGTLEAYKTTDGGVTWTRISRWVGTTGQYVHADIHNIEYYGTDRIIFGCDGGIHFSSDAGTTIRDRNVGLRVKQFYSVAVHPSTTNHFLAGAQDNGSHLLTSAGLGSSTEVTGGDGAWVHIDQDEPQYQFTSYVYNQYRRSTNGGSTWTSVNLSASIGQFINPTDYDDVANIMYCSNSAGTYRRWTNPQSGSTNASVTIPEFNSSNVLAVKVSPYTANRVYFGTAGGRVVYVDNANTIASGSSGTNISTGLPAASVSCVEIGTSENFLIATYSNYGVNQVNVSTNGGASWTAIDGNLPDMPVRWAIFAPNDNTRAIIATETGVWLTQLINGASTVWIASPSFPTVRTDMLQYRSSDGLVVAATHGRGLWSQSALSILPVNNFTLRGKWAGNINTDLQWSFEESNTGGSFTPEYSADGQSFSPAGAVAVVAGRNAYSFTHQPGSAKVYYRIKHTSNTGKVIYSNVIRLSRNGTDDLFQITKLFPNPVQSELKVAFTATGSGKTSYTITNISGQTVWRKEEDLSYTGSYIRNWNISQVPKGTYVFTITSNGKRISERFIKQ